MEKKDYLKIATEIRKLQKIEELQKKVKEDIKKKEKEEEQKSKNRITFLKEYSQTRSTMLIEFLRDILDEETISECYMYDDLLFLEECYPEDYKLIMESVEYIKKLFK